MSRQKVNLHFLGKLIIEDISVADNFWRRLSGYMFRKQPHVSGILFKSSGSIQTTFMRFDLDVIFLTKTFEVCKIQRNVRPWKVVFSPTKSDQVLEVPTGRLPNDLKIGDVLQMSS